MQTLHRQIAANVSFLFTRKWLVMLCLAAFVEAAGMGLTSPISSLYAQSFGLSTTLIGFFMTSFAIGRVLVNIPAGRLADRIGRRWLIVLGPFILSAAALGLATATTYTQLIASRLLHGIGSGIFMTCGYLVLADLSQPEDRGRVNSIFQSSIVLGLTISPSIGGMIATNLGYQAVYYFHSVIVFLVGIFLLRQFPESLKRLRSFTPVPKKRAVPWSGSPVNHLFVANSMLLVALAASIIFVSRSGSRDTILPLIGSGVFGLTPASIGTIFTLSAAVNLLAVPIAGYLADRKGRKPVILLGLTLNGLGLLFAGLATNLIPFVSGIMLMASGKGFGETSTLVYVADISTSERYGRSYGLFLSLRDLGLLSGPLTLGWVADRTNLHYPLLLNGIAMLVIMILFWFFAKESLSKSETRASVI